MKFGNARRSSSTVSKFRTQRRFSIEGADEALGDAVALGGADEAGRALDAQPGELLLEVVGEVGAPVVVAKLEPRGYTLLEGADALRDLPKAERAAQFLRDAVARLVAGPGGFLNPAIDPDDFEVEDYMEFDHYTIVKVGPGKLWFEIPESDENGTLGPIPVPKKATALLQEGWYISCALGRIKGRWRIIEVANVYPA